MQKKINNGETFGLWKTLESGKVSSSIKIKCLCSGCNTIYNVSTYSLVKNKSTKCVKCARRSRINYENFVGTNIGEWTVIKYMGFKKNKSMYLIRCSCGYETVKYKGNIRIKTINGIIQGKSCSSCANKKTSTKHGYSDKKIYKVWSSMLNRCNTPSASAYKHYGARGIKVSSDWHKFENFLKDMGDRPGEGLSIDRIDNSKGYSKSNCRWATKKQQARNTRSNVLIKFRVKKISISEIAEILNTKHSTIAKWVENNDENFDNIEDYLKLNNNEKLRLSHHSHQITYSKNGVIGTSSYWGKYLGITASSLRNKINKDGFDCAFEYYHKSKQERLFIEAGKKHKTYSFNNETGTSGFWANKIGINIRTFNSIIRRNSFEYFIKNYIEKKYNPKKIDIFTHNGESGTVPFWAGKFGISRDQLRKFINKHSFKESIDRYINKIGVGPKLYLFRGKTKSAKDWSNELNMDKAIFIKRLKSMSKNDFEEYSLIAPSKRSVFASNLNRQKFTFNGEKLYLKQIALNMNVNYRTFCNMVKKIGLEKAIEYYKNKNLSK